ncbi:MAG TPA: arylamine N-acetyltransferase [Cyclobacteriaceae bacterium]|nr:arylamine N-acetyltransferase [Cyclobacteriaceae bacterium]
MATTATQHVTDRDRVDREAYFSRIHYSGDRTPNLTTLEHIHSLHPKHIPFENLNPLLRLPVALDPASLSDKMLFQRRGGYCFEHNLLLKAVLESIGFTVRGLAARVLWNRPVDAITARSHMLLLIDIGSDRYIADVGFGGMTLTTPLLLTKDTPQETTHESFRLVDHDGDYRLEVQVRGEWKALYRFDLTEQHRIDYEVSSWYLSNNPESHFVSGLIAARVDDGIRHTLRNTEYSVHHLNGQTEKRTIGQVNDLEQLLDKVFAIEIPKTPGVSETFERILRTN